MPIYAYRCEHCGHAKDVLQKVSDPVLTVCPACGESTFRKQVTAAGFQLKGSGWYVTDFRGDKPGKREGAEANDGADGKGGGGEQAAAPKGAEAAAPAAADRKAAEGKAAETPKSAPAAATSPAPSAGLPSAGLPSVASAVSPRLAGLSPRKSVTYQPEPLSWKPAAVTCLRKVGSPQAGQTVRTGSDTFCSTSFAWPQCSHR